MGGNSSKVSKPIVENVIKQANQKVKAQPPNFDKTDISGQIKSSIEKKYTYLRQVEAELDKQAEKPKPAPLQSKTTWGKDPLKNLDAATLTKKSAEAEKILHDQSLAERLTSIGKLDENFKIQNFENKFENKEKDAIIRDSYKTSAQMLDPSKNPIGKFGKRPTGDIIDIITNHKNNPEGWTTATIAEFTKMRERDVKNLVKYYDLIGESNVKFTYPKEGIHYDETQGKWYTGPPIDYQRDSLAEKLDKVKTRKPLLPASEVKVMRQNKEAFAPVNKKHLKKLNDAFYINPDIYKEISVERDPLDRMLETHKTSPAKYSTDNLIDKLERVYRIELDDREIQQLQEIEAKTQVYLEKEKMRQSDPEKAALTSTDLERYQELQSLKKSVESYDKTKIKIHMLKKQDGKLKQEKKVYKYRDDAS